MNKAELIAKIADDAGITKTQANATIDAFIDAVTKTLKKGDKVTLVGFGTFSVSKRACKNFSFFCFDITTSHNKFIFIFFRITKV